MKLSKLIQAAVVTGSIALSALPLASNAAVTSIFSPGDLIKGSGDTVYYYGNDGARYVFPNSKTYFTWFNDFSKVKQIPDGLLGTIPLARQNITYRPGKKMVKITTDPKVYVVDQGGILRGIATEQLAQTLYGISWKNQIDDIPDAFFINYKVGTPIQTASDYQPANVLTLTTTIAQDKQMDETAATISIGAASTGYVPATLTVKKGTTVTWTNQDSTVHTVVGSGWQSQDLKYRESYQKQFNTVGSFDYHCGSHPVMQGTINVVQ